MAARNAQFKNNLATASHLFAAIFLAIFSGILSGFLGSSILRSSGENTPILKDIFLATYSFMFLLVLLGFGELDDLKNTAGRLLLLLSVSIAFSLILFDLAFLVDVVFFANAAILIYLIPATLLQRISYLIFDLTRKKEISKRLISTVTGLVMVFVSAVTAYFDLGSTYIKLGYMSQNLAFVSGCFVISLIVYANWKSLKKEKEKQSKLSVFKSFMIAFCTFGHTSYHDKNLSEVNFTNADLANIDLRARSFYQTCFRGATGLDRARLDDRHFDITNPKVQQLLTQGTTTDPDLSALNLQGAYLKAAEIPSCTLIGTNITRANLSEGNLRHTNLLRANLSGADLTGADLRGSILVQTDLTGTDLTGTNLTGACIENWNINGRTIFVDVQCDYIYRKLDDTGQPTDRYPRDRDFEPGEFASLYQEVENAVELIFKEGINWRAFAFSLQQLQIDDEGLGLQLQGIEKRGDLWVVKVTHEQNVSNAVVEAKLGAAYETLQQTLASKEKQVNQLLGIMSDQAEALKELSKKPFGNQFNITGSTITNLAGSGQIEYTEAADQVRSLIANSTNNAEVSQISQQFLSQLQHRLASTESATAELIYQIILTEAGKDPFFKQFILQQSVSLLAAIPQGSIATAFQTALETLRSPT
jgi:uncharacterized protein YjbI with pentapeptide repeats